MNWNEHILFALNMKSISTINKQSVNKHMYFNMEHTAYSVSDFFLSLDRYCSILGWKNRSVINLIMLEKPSYLSTKTGVKPYKLQGMGWAHAIHMP